MTKKIKEPLPEVVFPLKTGDFACIDTAPINMGFVVRNLKSDDFWHPKQIDITVTRQGFLYTDIGEDNIVEIVSRFGHDYENVFKKMDFVIAEKAIHDNVIRKTEGFHWSKAKCVSNTVKLELCLSMMFHSRPDFPPIIIKKAQWCRDATGVKVPNISHLSAEEQYRLNKQKSIDCFIERFGQARYELLCQSQYGNQCEDIIEAYWLGEAVKLEWDSIQKELLQLNNYNAVLFPTVRARIPAEERQLAWQGYPSHAVAPVKLLRESKAAYMKSKKEKKIKDPEARLKKLTKKTQTRKIKSNVTSTNN